MHQEHLENFGKIPQPPQEYRTYINDLRMPPEYCFEKSDFSGAAPGCMAQGADICLRFPETEDFPCTALESLHRLLRAKGIKEVRGTYPIILTRDPSLGEEEYKVQIQDDCAKIFASDSDGLRRAIYFLEDRITEAEGSSISLGEWRRKAFVKNRISRCFFGPTNRPPFVIDELCDEIDYYPEEYLNQLAHEGINGLWLTMYFRDLPSSIFPGRGKLAEKRFEKLRHVVKKCAAYGIRIFIFVSEPKRFGDSFFAVPISEAENHKELVGSRCGNDGSFCTSNETGKKYITESVSQIFQNVPDLGGMINIMYGEDNGSCTNSIINNALPSSLCPVCSKRDFADIYREQADLFTTAMHKYNPKAEYIGWFYAPGQRDDSATMQKLLHIAEKWPENASLMFNFESGGKPFQLGKQRVVFDYSLAYVGPSKLFAEATRMVSKSGAKIQVGCSHEDASVPYIPVPENLYEKYRFMYEHKVATVMQCWYFGNYPGLMNKIAGELSFEPFPKACRKFIADTIRPQWHSNTELVTEAMMKFSKAYQMFPANLLFEWYGLLHNCIAWPLFLFPEDKPIAPSWLLKQFPLYSGDRIGECIAFHHTLDEMLELCKSMSEMWQQGMDILEGLKDSYSNCRTCLMDIALAEAIGLQMKSAYNILKFYSLREDMLYFRKDYLAEMKTIVQQEIANSERMCCLCEKDSRLGYHSEAEGYLFYPEKLHARIELLKELLTEDFPKFQINDPRWDAYTGARPEDPVVTIYRKNTSSPIKYTIKEEMSFQAHYDDANIYFQFHNMRNQHFILAIEPCRHWKALCAYFYQQDRAGYANLDFADCPEAEVEYHDNDVFFTLPLHLFDGYRKKGFPMRFNVWSSDFHWIDPHPWPRRLQQESCDPKCMGWLVMQ